MAALQRRGLAAAVICSDPFLKLGQTQARIFGAPELPLVVIPHPLGGLALEDVKGRAAVAVEKLVALIKARAQ
jgi:hypothetical protein